MGRNPQTHEGLNGTSRSAENSTSPSAVSSRRSNRSVGMLATKPSRMPRWGEVGSAYSTGEAGESLVES